MKQVTIYTDGACIGNPGPGGWAAVLEYNGTVREIWGGEPHTTNNRMEMTAAVQALRVLKESCKVTLYTDSVYLRSGITQWLPAWKRKGWRTSQKKDVKNQDLWLALDQEASRHEVEWRWVKGHAGDPGNTRADLLANQAAREAMNTR